jgi:hypothetical protein
MIDDRTWLERPGTLRLLWMVFAIVLVATVAVELCTPMHGEFGLDGSFGFNAWYGFLACVGLVLLAKLLGVFLKRRDTFYGGDGG